MAAFHVSIEPQHFFSCSLRYLADERCGNTKEGLVILEYVVMTAGCVF